MGESPYKDSMILLDKLCVKIILVEYIYHCHLYYVLTYIKNKNLAII